MKRAAAVLLAVLGMLTLAGCDADERLRERVAEEKARFEFCVGEGGTYISHSVDRWECRMPGVAR